MTGPASEEALEWAAKIAVARRCAQEVRELRPDPSTSRSPSRCPPTTIGSGIPIALIPLVGAALSAGYGEEVFLGLAAFIALAAVVNLRPAAEPLAAR